MSYINKTKGNESKIYKKECISTCSLCRSKSGGGEWIGL